MKPQRIAPDVSYEWEMLNWTFRKLQCEDGHAVECWKSDSELQKRYFIGTSIDHRHRSAILESFLLHVRTIRDFLCDDKKRHPDDVLAIDFFEHGDEWKKVRPRLGPYLSKNRQRLNKAVAHLSYARISHADRDPQWDVSTIRHELDTIWNAFRTALSPEKQRWFPETYPIPNS